MMKKRQIIVWSFVMFSMHLLAGNARVIENFDFGWLFARYGLQPDGSRVDEPAAACGVTFDDSSWRTIDLPHDWAIEGPFRSDLEGFTGKLPWRAIGWYRKHFKVAQADEGKRFYLDFDGAMAHAEVWLNGKKMGGHPYGYSSFRVDLTPAVICGADNVVAVRLNTEEIGSRWYPGAGIYRHVRLVKTSPTHIDRWGAFVTTPDITDKQAKAHRAERFAAMGLPPAPEQEPEHSLTNQPTEQMKQKESKLDAFLNALKALFIGEEEDPEKKEDPAPEEPEKKEDPEKPEPEKEEDPADPEDPEKKEDPEKPEEKCDPEKKENAADLAAEIANLKAQIAALKKSDGAESATGVETKDEDGYNAATAYEQLKGIL